MSGGDGASFNFADYGQDGSPLNPCGDPPGGRRPALTPPTAEGGALRSQDLRTPADPVTLDGADPPPRPGHRRGACRTTRSPSAPTPNARRIIAHGLRNPFRFDRPAGHQRGLGRRRRLEHVGGDQPRSSTPTARSRTSAGPATRASARQSGYDGANLNICENLYGAGPACTAPYYTYNHTRQGRRRARPARPAARRSPGSRSTTAATYPAAYEGALFFADYSRDCIWAMLAGANGLPNPATIADVRRRRGEPGRPRDRPGRRPLLRRPRRRHDPADPLLRGQPAADGRASRATPDERRGAAHRQLRRHRLERPRRRRHAHLRLGSRRRRAVRRLDAARPTAFTYTAAGSYTARLRVTDTAGASDARASRSRSRAGNTPPDARRSTRRRRRRPGRSATRSPSPAPPPTRSRAPCRPSRLTWSLVLHHCPLELPRAPVQDFIGIASGSLHRRPTTSTRRTSSCASRRPTRAV